MLTTRFVDQYNLFTTTLLYLSDAVVATAFFLGLAGALLWVARKLGGREWPIQVVGVTPRMLAVAGFGQLVAMVVWSILFKLWIEDQERPYREHALYLLRNGGSQVYSTISEGVMLMLGLLGCWMVYRWGSKR